MHHNFFENAGQQISLPKWRFCNRRTFVIDQIKKYFSSGTTASENISTSIWKLPYKSKNNDDSEE